VDSGVLMVVLFVRGAKLDTMVAGCACCVMNARVSSQAIPPSDSDVLFMAVRGMSCAACVARVEKALRKVPGVAQAQVNFATEMASVTPVSGGAVPGMDALVSAIEAAGYHAQPQTPGEVQTEAPEPWWSVWGAVCLGAAASVPLLLPMLWGQHHG
jgi:Cu+-exporting ATPase